MNRSKIFIHTCKRCGYQWPSRLVRPKTCASPKCRSPYWDKERKRKAKPSD